MIGDPVNVAARIQAATRETGDEILIADRTRELLSGDHPELEERKNVELRGKQETVRVYSPRGRRGESTRRRSRETGR